MGTKTVVSFVNIFMAHIETAILSKSVFKPTVWKRYIVFSLWDISKPDIETLIEEANLHHSSIKFTAEISDTEIVFLNTIIYKDTRFHEKSILDAKTHFKKKRKPSSTHITLLVTKRVLKKDLSKEKPLESYEQTPQKLRG